MNAIMQRMQNSPSQFVSVFFKLFTLSLFSLIPTLTFAACGDDWIARVVSVQGKVDVRAKDTESWQSAELQKVYCRGDTFRVKENSRAALELHNETILRLNQNSTLILSGPKKASSWIDLITGTLHSISRVPRALKVGTPFVNADVEGTEFLVEVRSDNTLVGVIEGKVAVSNEQGRVLLTKNQSAVSFKGKAPVLRLDIKPEDSVQWSLFYPRLNVPGLQSAEDLLSVGQVDAAEAALKGQDSAAALSLRSIIAVAKNNKVSALALADKAIGKDANSAAAYLAHSYAQQAYFDLKAAKRSAQKATELQPEQALVWARLAELQLSTGELEAGLASARRANELQPDLARTQTILGFAHLVQFDTSKAKQSFERSFVLDSADPLARLGQGLAEIRDGHLEQGRRYIEIAASLDPNNALIRSYLGKAYYEENRSRVAGDQLQLAKEMDPADPTAWFYNAIRLQSDNRPVEAMLDLQESIRLNDNRAVYRSRQLLDQDAAARSASVARIYDTLGFGQVALQEGTKSVDIDPSNHSAHRFLADSYASIPRHEIARVSELLQAQLLQPLNANPIQPQLALSSLGVLDGAGPIGRASSDFNPLFSRDGTRYQINGVVGNNGTRGEDVTISGIHDNIAYSVGQYRFETDGYRVNNDLKRDIFNVFLQADLNNKTSLQGELRLVDESYGDLTLQFDPTVFADNEREDRITKSARIGLHHRVSTQYDFLASVVYQDYKLGEVIQFSDSGTVPFPFNRERNELKDTVIETLSTELQLIKKGDNYNYVAGIGNLEEDSYTRLHTLDVVTSPVLPAPLVRDILRQEDPNAYYWNIYYYSQLAVTDEVTLSLGAAYDKLANIDYNVSSLNPKLGLTWLPAVGSTVRLAYIEGIGRPLNANQTIEPSQVAGFNQFFADFQGAKTKRYGIAFEQQFSSTLFTGIEFSRREVEALFSPTFSPSSSVDQRDEAFHRAYAYWAPTKRLALSVDYYHEEQEGQLLPPLRLKTQRIPLGARYFWQGENFASLTATHIDQEFTDNTSTRNSDFWLLDLGVGFRLPKRLGSFQLVVNNLLDKSFSYYDIGELGLTRGARIPDYIPDRQIQARFTIAIQ